MKKRLESLTPREHEVAFFISRGLTYTEMAEKLSISPYTVKEYEKKIRFKLGVSRRIHVAVIYVLHYYNINDNVFTLQAKDFHHVNT